MKTTPRREPLRRRMTAFVAAVALGALGITWIDTRIWNRMQDLERGFAAVKTERFYHGVRIRLDLQFLNEKLLEFQLRGDTESLEAFLRDALALRRQITRLEQEVDSAKERAIYADLRQAYDGYLKQTVTAQERTGLFGPSRRKVDQIHESLSGLSQPIFSLCEDLIRIQRQEFSAFLVAAQDTLSGFQDLITLSILLLIALAALVVVLVYRGMVRPLRLRLSQSEAAMQRHEKLAALGTLAAGVAHEIRNPLTAIKFRLFSLRQQLPPTPAPHEDAAVIDDEINRLERIVKDFIQFGRPSNPQWVEVPVARILDEINTLMMPELQDASIQLNMAVSHDIWVRVDTQQCKQVMINLIQNAVDSIQANGTITITAAHEYALLAGTRQLATVIKVTDTGKGIPPEARPRLFDPFFTTKEGGTGLGLAIAARIIENLGGELDYETELNRGTTFRILLPHIRGQNE